MTRQQRRAAERREAKAAFALSKKLRKAAVTGATRAAQAERNQRRTK